MKGGGRTLKPLNSILTFFSSLKFKQRIIHGKRKLIVATSTLSAGYFPSYSSHCILSRVVTLCSSCPLCTHCQPISLYTWWWRHRATGWREEWTWWPWTILNSDTLKMGHFITLTSPSPHHNLIICHKDNYFRKFSRKTFVESVCFNNVALTHFGAKELFLWTNLKTTFE